LSVSEKTNPVETPSLFKQSSETLSPLFLQLLAKKGFDLPEKIEAFLFSSLQNLEDPYLMKGMTEAVERIRAAVRNQEKILVHGDYDVDGVTGTAVVAKTLSVLEANFATFLPDRSVDGYGVSERAIEEAHGKGARLLITVDCGITAMEEIKLARSLGMDVIVIDHHRIPNQGVPPATAIINPQQNDCPYPFKDLSAAGLAFKLSYALLGERAYDFLDLAALSTVCDVAPLKSENRIVVKKGLEILSKRSNLGVRAMVKSAGLKAREINVGHIGFMIGPRINAAGRMSSPDIALQLLLTHHEKEAESLATILEEENKARQKEERQVVKEALAEVEKVVNFNRDRVIVVAREGWHAGVIGIVASRLVDRYHRPAVVIAFDQGKGKGSGRSIKGFHLFDALDSCKEFFEEFGGHEQAAGLSMKKDNLAAFRTRINDYAREKYDANAFVKKTPVDLPIRFDELRAGFMQELNLLEPHGAGNPRPVFSTDDLEIKTKPERLGESSLKFWITDGALTFEAIWNDKSGLMAGAGLEKGSKVNLIYTIKTKVWDGIQTVTLEVKEVTPKS
jgi:single-stranded-DNA-specific exonuclease